MLSVSIPISHWLFKEHTNTRPIPSVIIILELRSVSPRILFNSNSYSFFSLLLDNFSFEFTPYLGRPKPASTCNSVFVFCHSITKTSNNDLWDKL